MKKKEKIITISREGINKVKRDMKEEIGISKYINTIKKKTCFKDYKGL